MLAPAKPIVLYWDTFSGHAHRVELFLALTHLPYTIKQVELPKGEHRKPDYLAINPLGKLPAIDDAGTIVRDSNAILIYLASKYEAAKPWLPSDPGSLAEIVRYLSFAAGPVESGPGDARLLNLAGGNPQYVEFFGATTVDPVVAANIAAAWLPRFDRELAGRTFLVGERPTIADVANYTYIAHAPEGGISLTPYPHIRSWLRRIEALPGFVPMQPAPIGLRKAA